MHGFTEQNRSEDFSSLDASSMEFVSFIQKCQIGAVGADLAYDRMNEALAHGWRALALYGENRRPEAIQEQTTALQIEKPLLTDSSLPSIVRDRLRKNYDAITKRRDDEIKKSSPSPAQTAD
jgi:hypothetical protein